MHEIFLLGIFRSDEQFVEGLEVPSHVARRHVAPFLVGVKGASNGVHGVIEDRGSVASIRFLVVNDQSGQGVLSINSRASLHILADQCDLMSPTFIKVTPLSDLSNPVLGSRAINGLMLEQSLGPQFLVVGLGSAGQSIRPLHGLQRLLLAQEFDGLIDFLLPSSTRGSSGGFYSFEVIDERLGVCSHLVVVSEEVFDELLLLVGGYQALEVKT